MTFIKTIAASDTSPEVSEMYSKLRGDRDYLPNYAQLYCYRPAVMDAWSGLQKTILKTLDHRRYELVTLAAAQAIRSSYCSLAHAQVLGKHYYDDTELEAIVARTDDGPLDSAEKAMMAFARKVATNSTGITQEDIDELKERGFDDAQIFDITAAAARCFFAKISDALGAQPDSEFLGMGDSLRDLLTVGRDIEPPGSASTSWSRGGTS